MVPMAELVDALVSDANSRKAVEVRVLFGAPYTKLYFLNKHCKIIFKLLL